MLTALSLGARGGTGFLPAPGRFGGAGGVGFAFAAAGRVPLMPFVDGGGAGTARMAGAGGAGGAGGAVGLGASSMRYAEGAHPWEEPSSFLASHQPGIEVSRLYG